MPAPGICEGAIRICFGLVLGLGSPRFRRGLLLSAEGGGDAFVIEAAFVSVARLRAFAVLLLVLYLVVLEVIA